MAALGVRVRARFGVCLLAALAFGGPLTVLAVLDQRWPLPEVWAAVAVLAAVGLAIGLWGLLLWRLRLPDTRQVALAIEERSPELMDSLICAIELQQQHAGNLTAMQQAQMTQAFERLGRRPLAPLLAHLAPGLGRLALLALLALVLAGLGHVSELGSKARAYAWDRLNGINSGLTVQPGDSELGLGDTLRVEVVLHRGPDRAWLEWQPLTGPATVYDMYPVAPGRHSFEIFGVEGDARYRVRSATLRRWSGRYPP